MTSFFPSFVNNEENERIMDEVSKDELQEVIHSFQKDKSHEPDGCPIELSLRFL